MPIDTLEINKDFLRIQHWRCLKLEISHDDDIAARAITLISFDFRHG